MSGRGLRRRRRRAQQAGRCRRRRECHGIVTSQAAALLSVVDSGTERPLEPLDPREISPELVLVDPELASRARSALEVAARPQAPVFYALDRPRRVPLSVPRAVNPPPSTRRRSRVLAGFLGASVFVSLALVAVLISRSTTTTESASPIHAASRRQTTESNLRSVPEGRTERDPTSPVQEGRTESELTRPVLNAKAAGLARPGAAAERAVFALALSHPHSKVGRKLIDANSGLVKQHARVTCRQSSGGPRPQFECLVETGITEPAFNVFYTPSQAGRARITWSGDAKSP